MSYGQLTTDSRLSIDGCLRREWRFEETLLDASHCVSVALKLEKPDDEEVRLDGDEFKVFGNVSDILCDLKPLAYQENGNDWTDFKAKYKTKSF